MPEWNREIANRLTGLKLEPTREAEIVENPTGQTLQDAEGHSFEVVGVAQNLSSMRLGGSTIRFSINRWTSLPPGTLAPSYASLETLHNSLDVLPERSGK